MTDTVEEKKEPSVILTAKQELFCQFYTTNRELFGNGTLCYDMAYDYKLHELSDERPVKERDEGGKPIEWGKSEHSLAYDVCSVNASQLLRKPKINDRITVLLNEMLTDDEVDSVLSEIIKSRHSKGSDRINAIREYNKVKGRIIEKKDITTGGKPILAPLHDSINPIGDSALTAEPNEVDIMEDEF